MFSKRELQRRRASAHIIERIARKQRGGRSGSAGYRQEDFFATCKMISAARRYIERGEQFWMIQNAEALVDDLVTGNGTHDFYQVKTGSGITWASLHADFLEQRTLCKLFGLKHYKLTLVVSSVKDRERLVRQRPRTLTRTHVISFPQMQRTSDLATTRSPVLEDLSALCAGRAGSGDVASIAAWAFTTVLDRPTRSKRFGVAQFLRALRRHPSIPIREHFVDPSPLWRRAARVLGTILDLTVSIEEGFFVFDYCKGMETGRVAKCGTADYRRLLKRIVDSSPKDFEAFERLL